MTHVIGIIGGIASGKSLVTKHLVMRGAKELGGDAAGHAVLRDPDVIEAIHQRWGGKVLTPEGEVDRAAVAKLVFGEGKENERAFLDQLTHPRIKARLVAELNAHRADRAAVVVLDAALLLEAGWADLCTAIWFIDTPREQRQQRARLRGWSDEMFAAREAAQWPLERKRKFASAEIDNSGTADATRAQVDELLSSIEAEAN